MPTCENDRPTPHGYCHACGYSHLHAGDKCQTLSVRFWRTMVGPRPLTLDAAVQESVNELMADLNLTWAPGDNRRRADVLRLVVQAMAV